VTFAELSGSVAAFAPLDPREKKERAMSFIMRIVNMFLRMFGMGGLARLNTDAHRIARMANSGNAAGAQAHAMNMSNNNAAGAYGTPGMGGAVPPGYQPGVDMATQNAFIQQTMVNAQQHAQKTAAATAANPGLVAPIEGVTIEQYAQICAKAAQNLPPDQFDQMLMQQGMDRAKYDRVAAGWNARMRDDTTYALSTIYGQAFGGAGAGQFGAAGAAGADSRAGTGASGQAQGVGGGEPVSWEKYNEIGGAQRAWSQSGKDVNAMLQQQFGVNALDWSNMSQYWMSRMMTDPQKMMEMNTLQEQWAARYAAPKADQDLQF